MMSRMGFLSAGYAVLVSCSLASALVGDPQIMTDHPVYRGELSCSTLDRNIADAYRIYKDRYGHEPKTDTEKVVALWAWKSEHYMHACDNKVYVGPDNLEADKTGWMDCRDCQMDQFSFSFGLCYSVHAQMTALVGHALGDLKCARAPGVPGHVPFEAFADGRWILADFTTGLMVFDDDGKPIGLKEIMAHTPEKDREWFDSPKRGGPYKFSMSPFGDRLEGYGTQLNGKQLLYGYNAMPIVYSLRTGESFTRYLDPGLEDGKTFMFWGRDYWGINGKPKHGPFRNVTFMDSYPVGNGQVGRGNTYTSNGVFEYVPPLADGKYKEGVKSEKDVTFADGALRGKAAGASMIFEHVSPYVIAARPVEAGDREWNVFEEKCVDGAIVSGTAVGKVPVAVSVDGGQKWQTVGQAAGTFTIDFTDIVKGRHQYLVRLGLTKDDGLKSLKLRTVTQVGRGVFPRLKDGGTTVTYEASGQSVIHGGPSQYLAEPFRRKDLEKDGWRVYQVRAPGVIRHVAGVARANGPGFGPWSVEFSLDGGKTWKAGMKELKVTPEETDWGGGHHAYAWAAMDFLDNRDAKDALVRFGEGNILHCQVFATYESKSRSAMEVTYGWTEDGKMKQDTHRIDPGKKADTWTVPTGQKVQTKWVRFAAR